MGSVSLETAKQILKQYENWYKDQELPPGLRDGYYKPDNDAVRLARLVIQEREPDWIA